MSDSKTDYRQLAPNYDQRYQVNRLDGVAQALTSLVQGDSVRRALEVGCGTGRWLAEIAPLVEEVHGLDPSPDMLAKARARSENLILQAGKAETVPYPDSFFDVIFCVNAIHHFDNAERFIEEVRRVLAPGGVLAIIGMDPRDLKERYDLYRFFKGTYEADLRRFPPHQTVMRWLANAGFHDVQRREVQRITEMRRGRDILDYPFLKKDSCSQLALLSQEQYEEGLRCIREAIEEGERAGEDATFSADISLEMTSCRKGKPDAK